MDFEKIDSTYGDSLGSGDIVAQDGEFHQITGTDEDGDDVITYLSLNLSTGDDDDRVLVGPGDQVDLYRVY